MSNVLGVIVIARNGDRTHYLQDPNTYAGYGGRTTALGEVQSHALGERLRKIYLTSSSPSYIPDMNTELADPREIKVRIKAGTEGTVVFDSAIALLQGLFPPNEKNQITLADGKRVMAPLGGYQYIPVETVEPENDRSLEGWTNCPNFQKHAEKFHASDDFKKKERDAKPFFEGIKDFVFGRQTSLANIWNLYDFINTQLVHNQTYAFRLPPTFIEQARGLADFHENGVFSDNVASGIGNVAGRTMMHTVLTSLEQIAFNGNPLQFLLISTTYQPFISLFHQVGIIDAHPQLAGIPDYGSALAIELIRSGPPEVRDFLRFKFLNGSSGNFENLHVFGKKDGDIPLTEFIYRAEGAVIQSNREWRQVCGVGRSKAEQILDVAADNKVALGSGFALVFALFALLLMFRAFKKRRTGGNIRLEDERLNTQVGDKKVVSVIGV